MATKTALTDLFSCPSLRARAAVILADAQHLGEIYTTGAHPLIRQAINGLVRGGWLELGTPNRRHIGTRFVPVR